MHPTAEHLLPYFVAAGAGGGRATRLRASLSFGVLGMDAYAFRESAAALARTLPAAPPTARA